jgi:glucose 1-dehydrogenase
LANRLEGKIALVTGGDQGIGHGIALRLAKEGADVAIGFRQNKQGAEETIRAIEQLGRKCIAIQGDVSKIEDGRQLVTQTVTQLGRIDILVNNAGLERGADFWDVTEQDYDLVMNVNLKGVFFITQFMVRHLMETKRPGKIINISSVHEELPFPHFASYCASKGALKMLARDLAIELAPFGITVNNIAPGAIETPINTKLLNDPAKLNELLDKIPLRRLGKPEDVAGMAAFLASSDADYVTGTTFFIDGGLLWNYHEQ